MSQEQAATRSEILRPHREDRCRKSHEQRDEPRRGAWAHPIGLRNPGGARPQRGAGGARRFDARGSDQAFGHRRLHRLPRGREEAEDAEAASDDRLRHDAGSSTAPSGDCRTTIRWWRRAIGGGGRKWPRRPGSGESPAPAPKAKAGPRKGRQRRPEGVAGLLRSVNSVGQPDREVLERLPGRRRSAPRCSRLPGGGPRRSARARRSRSSRSRGRTERSWRCCASRR